MERRRSSDLGICLVWINNRIWYISYSVLLTYIVDNYINKYLEMLILKRQGEDTMKQCKLHRKLFVAVLALLLFVSELYHPLLYAAAEAGMTQSHTLTQAETAQPVSNIQPETAQTGTTVLAEAAQSGSDTDIPAQSGSDSDIPVQAVGINVTYHTQDEIRAYIKSNGASPDDPVIYKVKPSIEAPYNAGSLSDQTLDSAIRMLNQIRYIAGLSHELKLNNSYNEMVQAASLVNCVNYVLTHYPEKPADMEDSLYRLGAEGASSSNLAAGYGTINCSLVYGYMEDGDSSNIDRVGHRRWILNPSMSVTGFGYCYGYSGMYAHNMDNTAAAEYGVVWPAQTMPTDYFGTYYPWSISMGYYVNRDNVQVTLVRLRDNKSWSFCSSSSDGYFNVDNNGYGQRGCIIFRPDGIDAYQNNDRFQVTITGLNTPVSYQVNFFDLKPVTSVSIKKSDKKITIDSFLYLEAQVTPSDASNQSIAWSSSDEKVATVSDYGLVQGVGYGKAVITATSLSSGLSANYEITVIPNPIYIKELKTSKKGQLTVSYRSDKTVSGYEIVYATNVKFTKNKKTKVVTKSSTSKVTIKDLKSGQGYYVKIRAYAVVNGKKIYGEYGWDDYIWVK